MSRPTLRALYVFRKLITTDKTVGQKHLYSSRSPPKHQGIKAGLKTTALRSNDLDDVYSRPLGFVPSASSLEPKATSQDLGLPGSHQNLSVLFSLLRVTVSPSYSTHDELRSHWLTAQGFPQEEQCGLWTYQSASSQTKANALI